MTPLFLFAAIDKVLEEMLPLVECCTLYLTLCSKIPGLSNLIFNSTLPLASLTDEEASEKLNIGSFNL